MAWREKLSVGELSLGQLILGRKASRAFYPANGLLGGAGTSAVPVETSENSKNLLEFRFKTSATGAGSDTRLLYLQAKFAGITTGGGETARIYSVVQAAAGTVRGAHVSLDFDGTTANVSGLGTALSGTLHLKNTGTMTGTLAAIEAQAHFNAGADDDVVLPGTHALFRGTVSGDSGNVASFVNFLHLDLPAACIVDAGTDTTHMVTTGIAVPTINTALRARIGGTTYWFCMTTAIVAD